MTVRLRRLIGWLVSLYPRRFREAYGEELEAAIRHRWDGRAQGAGGANGSAGPGSKGGDDGAAGRMPVRSGVMLVTAVAWNALLAWLDEAVRRMKRRSTGRGRGGWPGWRSDARYVRRSLVSSPGYALLVVAVLAVSVSAVTAAAGFVRGTLLRRLPYPDAKRVVLVWGSNASNGQVRDVISGPNFLDLREATRSLTGLAAVHADDGVLLERDRPEVLDVLEVSVEFLRTLGISPARGRDFGEGDRTSSGPAVAIVSHAFWRDRLGSDDGAIGRVLRLSGRSHTVVGVLPESFEFLLPAPVLVPLHDDQLAAADRTTHHYWLFGRLAPGASPGDATRELSAVFSEIATADPRMTGWSVLVEPLERISVAAVRPVLYALAAAVALVLLAGAANLANLHGVRAMGRVNEWYVRRALGARVASLGRLVAIEAGVLVVTGTVAGLAGGLALLDALARVVPARIPIPGSAAVVNVVRASWDGGVLAAGLFAGVGAGVFFIAPALLRLARTDGPAAARSGTRVAGSPVGSRPLIVAELVLAMLLLVGAGLLSRSATRLLAVDPGVDPNNLLTLYVGDDDDADNATLARYFREVVRRVESVPGVVQAGAIDYVPFTGEDDYKGIRFEDRPPPAPGQGIREEWRRVTDGYFEAAGLTMVRGRRFDVADFEDVPAVVIVNDAFARKYWPGIDPVGRRFRISSSGYDPLEVVGVVEDVPERGFALPAPPMLFVPLHGEPRDNMALFVRTESAPLALLDAIRDAVWSVDATQPIDRILPMTALVSATVAVPALARTVVAVLASFALGLAVLGVAAVVSHIVRARRRELSIRIVLGATPHRIRRDLLADIMPLILIGLLLGAAAGVTAGTAARSLLHEVSPIDPVTLLGAAAVLITAATLATWLPARSVTRLDPADAMRIG